MLGLDLVVRDDQGNILDPLNTSTINLFQQVGPSALKYIQEHDPYFASVNFYSAAPIICRALWIFQRIICVDEN